MERHQRHHGGPHVNFLVNESVSKLVPSTGLILTLVLVVIFITRFYVFECCLMTRLYGKKYSSMNEIVRRGFVNHHVAATIKIIILATAAYPFFDVAFGSAMLHSSFDGNGGIVTMGDILLVCSQLFIGMYVFELLYRPKISPVSSLHHVGAIVIAQAAVALSVDFEHESDASIEFILCCVWGAFDIVAEFLPHIAIILYRIRPNDHKFLVKIFRTACVIVVLGTTMETVVVMWLFGGLWDRWTLPFKLATPILHIVFSMAQLWGAVVFRRMYKRQMSLLAEAESMDKL